MRSDMEASLPGENIDDFRREHFAQLIRAGADLYRQRKHGAVEPAARTMGPRQAYMLMINIDATFISQREAHAEHEIPIYGMIGASAFDYTELVSDISLR